MRLAGADVAHAEALLELAGALALSCDDAGNDPVLEPPAGEAPLWPNVIVRALFPAHVDLAALASVLADACGGHVIAMEPLDDERWQAAARRAPTQRRIGARLWLSDARASSAAQAGEAEVRLAMGLAFGTGDHPTTALCLEWLEAHVRAETRLLDYGCGSGVLALAALALGAAAAWAVDNDSQALTATADNARLNGVAERLWLGPPEALPKIAADVVVANILAGPLVALAPTLSACAAPGAALVLAGILDSQREDVMRAYAPFCAEFELAERDGWARITARRRAG